MAQNMQAARREETRERILAAAEKVIIEKGVRDASLKDISKGAKISAGTLYYHFNTKDSIMFELAERNLKRMTAGIVEKIAVEGEDSCSTQMFAEALDQVLKESMQARLHLYLISNFGLHIGTISKAVCEMEEVSQNTFSGILFGRKGECLGLFGVDGV